MIDTKRKNMRNARNAPYTFVACDWHQEDAHV